MEKIFFILINLLSSGLVNGLQNIVLFSCLAVFKSSYNSEIFRNGLTLSSDLPINHIVDYMTLNVRYMDVDDSPRLKSDSI